MGKVVVVMGRDGKVVMRIWWDVWIG